LDVLGFPGFEEENCNNCSAKSSKKKKKTKACRVLLLKHTRNDCVILLEIESL